MNQQQIQQQQFRRQATMRRRLEDAQARSKNTEFWRWVSTDARDWVAAGPMVVGVDPGSPEGDATGIAFMRASAARGAQVGEEPTTVPLDAMEEVAEDETLEAIRRAQLSALTGGVGAVLWADGRASTVDMWSTRPTGYLGSDLLSPYGFGQEPDEQTDDRGVPDEMVRAHGGKVYEVPALLRAGGTRKTMRFRRYAIPPATAGTSATSIQKELEAKIDAARNECKAGSLTLLVGAEAAVAICPCPRCFLLQVEMKLARVREIQAQVDRYMAHHEPVWRALDTARIVATYSFAIIPSDPRPTRGDVASALEGRWTSRSAWEAVFGDSMWPPAFVANMKGAA